MTSKLTECPWPESVWDVPVLRGLDARSRSEVRASGRAFRVRAGASLFAPGDPADSLFIVAEGSVSLSEGQRGGASRSVVRRAERGDVFGEDAAAADFSTRKLEARCAVDAIVVEVLLHVLKRAVGRSAGANHLAKVERSLRRSATRDLLRTSPFARDLHEEEIDILLDSATHRHVVRGDFVYREGEAAAEAFFVADGLLQIQTGGDGTRRIEAYLGRGELFGDEELATNVPRAKSVVASGPTWIVSIPRDAFLVVARRSPDGLVRARRMRADASARDAYNRDRRPAAHGFPDLYRLRIARSLLVIDQDACTRCGHCAFSCAAAHDDGVSRLTRRGDTIVVASGEVEPSGARIGRTLPLLVVSSCQHCKSPSCMIDCPTGAIARDARGEVFVREELCTGCGSCAKACPWESIQMSSRKDVSPYPTVAVKCDLCKGVDGGPACVASCPSQAIARIDPNEALVELRDPGASAARGALGSQLLFPSRVPAWPWGLGAVFAGVGAAVWNGGRWSSGILAGVLLTLLAGYALAKRARGPMAKWRGAAPLSRWLYIGHVCLGTVTVGVIASHVAGSALSGIAGALTLSVLLAALIGALGVAMATIVPRSLTRVERSSVLPEDFGAISREIDEKIFTALSGKSELVKVLFVEALRPYRRALFGPVTLILSRRTLDEEERALLARLDRLMEGRKSAAPAGLEPLVKLVVEHRAFRARRVLTWGLRAWLVPHLALSAAAVVFLALHVIAVSGFAPNVGQSLAVSAAQHAPHAPSASREVNSWEHSPRGASASSRLPSLAGRGSRSP